MTHFFNSSICIRNCCSRSSAAFLCSRLWTFSFSNALVTSAKSALAFSVAFSHILRSSAFAVLIAAGKRVCRTAVDSRAIMSSWSSRVSIRACNVNGSGLWARLDRKLLIAVVRPPMYVYGSVIFLCLIKLRDSP
jgi:hypothetical protein